MPYQFMFFRTIQKIYEHEYFSQYEFFHGSLNLKKNIIYMICIMPDTHHLYINYQLIIYDIT